MGLRWLGVAGGVILFANMQAIAGQSQAPDFSVRVEVRGAMTEVQATPPAGHHFNTQAPMKMNVGPAFKLQPKKASQSSVIFSVKAAELPAGELAGIVSLYLCDDRNTFCERHDVAVQLNPGEMARGKPGQESLPRKPKSSKPMAPHASPSVRVEPSGFILNDPKAAFSKAEKEKKPLLIDVFGIWCPPCNQLDAEVFSTSEFKKASAGFVLLKLDADSDVSWDFRLRYRVTGYPTVLFASFDGQEIQRVVGFSGKDAFFADMKKAWEHRGAPAAAAKDDARLGRMYLERREYELARKHLSNVPAQREAYFSAEIGLIEEKLAKAAESQRAGLRRELISTLEKVDVEFPATIDALERKVRRAELLEETGGLQKKRMEALHEAAELAEKFLKGEGKLTSGYQTEDVLQLLAGVQESLGEPEKAKATWLRAAEAYAGKIRSEKDRGYHLERAYCLWKSGDFAGAEKIYQEMEKYFPSEFTFYYAHASMNLERKDSPNSVKEAIKQANSAYEHSYGDNRLRSGHLLARALREDGKRAEAKAVVEKTLAAARNPQDDWIRTGRYIKNLEKLRAELN